MNVSTFKTESINGQFDFRDSREYREPEFDFRDSRAYREPRITHDQLKAMKRVDNQTERQKITVRAWLEEQINDLIAFVKVIRSRSKSNCATRGHRVSAHNARLRSCKCADCGAIITSTEQIRQGLQHAQQLANAPDYMNPNGSNFWVDEAAIDRKITNRKKKTRAGSRVR